MLSKIEKKTITFLKSLKATLKWPLVCKNWWIGILSYLRLLPPDKSYLYLMRDGLELWASGDTGDFQIIREIYVHDTYSKNLNEQSIKAIIDIGAHKGYTALHYARLFGPKTRIYCYEADPRNAKYLKKNVNYNNFQNQINVETIAIYSSAGTLEMYTTDYSPGTSIYKNLQKGDKNILKVPSKTLTDVLNDIENEEVSLLKVDIEGAEYDVFFNTDTNILSKISTLVIECHAINNYSINDMKTYLQNLGYTCTLPYKFETLAIFQKR